MNDPKKQKITQYDMDSVIRGISNPEYRPVGVHLARSIYQFYQQWIDEVAEENGWEVRLKGWDALSEDAQMYWYCQATQMFVAAHNENGMLPDDLAERIDRVNPGLAQRVEGETKETKETKETIRDQIAGLDKRFWN